jgi:hypothetical protein
MWFNYPPPQFSSQTPTRWTCSFNFYPPVLSEDIEVSFPLRLLAILIHRQSIPFWFLTTVNTSNVNVLSLVLVFVLRYICLPQRGTQPRYSPKRPTRLWGILSCAFDRYRGDKTAGSCSWPFSTPHCREAHYERSYLVPSPYNLLWCGAYRKMVFYSISFTHTKTVRSVTFTLSGSHTPKLKSQ